MKKLLGTTLALAMLLPAGANAELLKNFKMGGQLDIQTTSARNIADFATRPHPTGTPANNDRLGHATTRVIVKADWDVLDDVHARVTLVKGAEGSGGTSRVYGAAAQDLNTIQTQTLVQEAFVKIDKVFGALDVTAGRQFFGEEGDLIAYYGPRNNYGLLVTALDVFRADWNGEHMSLTGIAGKTSDTTVAALGNVATDLRGLVASCKGHEMIKPTVYVYNMVQHAAGGLGSPTGKNTNLWVAGAKAKIMSGGFSSHFEFAKNFGEDRTTAQNTNFKGWAFLTKLGYKADVSNVGMFNPWGEFGYGTGDSNFDYAGNNNFQAIATDYRPGGIYGRFDNSAAVSLGQGIGGFGGSSNGLSNRIIWGFGVNMTPSAISKLTTGVQYYRYAFNRLPNLANGQRNSRNIGSEVDVTGEWKHSENVSFKATAGTFQPGAYVADVKGANAALNPAVMLAGDVSIRFY
ncbi:MAG: hypothetical protein AAB036_03665 [Elusimicrobiota bacterium]